MTKKKYISKRESRRLQKKAVSRIMSLGFLIVLLAVVGFIVFSPENPSTPLESDNLQDDMFGEIPVETAYQKYQAGVFFLDVREMEEWELSRIPNSVNIPFNLLSSRLSELPEDEEIIIICNSGIRSMKAVEYLVIEGFVNIFSVRGGISEWHARGFPTVGNVP